MDALTLPSFEEIFHASVDCLKVIDAQGTLVRVCRLGSLALEYEGECPMLGESWYDAWSEPYRQMAECAVAAAEIHGSGRFVGFCPTYRKTDKWWDVLISPLRIEGEAHFFVVISRDISQLKAQERGNLHVIHELERERMSREQFVATLTHDMRNPLSAARMSAQMILNKAKTQKRVAGLASRIDRCLERADAMITDLLDVAQLRAGKPIKMGIEPMDLKRLANETLHDLALTAGPRFNLICKTSNVDALCNEHAFRRILENLASNALKYGDPTAQVTITLQRLPHEVCLRVHNEGPHIAEADCKTLFDMYRRTASAHASRQSGWGLGLTVVRGLSAALGGVVRVESSAEAGTTFVVQLPQPPETEVHVERVPSGRTAPPSERPAADGETEAELHLAASPEHAPRWFDAVLENISDAVIGSTADGRISLLNRAAQAMCGYSNDEARGRLTQTLLTLAEGSAAASQNLTTARQPATGDKAIHMLLCARTGERHAVVAQVTPIHDDAGSPFGHVYIVRAAAAGLLAGPV